MKRRMPVPRVGVEKQRRDETWKDQWQQISSTPEKKCTSVLHYQNNQVNKVSELSTESWVLPSGWGCDLKPNSREKSGPSQSLWQARGKTASNKTRRDSKYARMVSSATLESLRPERSPRLIWTKSRTKEKCLIFLPVNQYWDTHMLTWSFMKSHTIRLLLSLAKYMAVFLCLDKMLQSAPYSSRRRTTSALPLLQAWCKKKLLKFEIRLYWLVVIRVYRALAGWWGRGGHISSLKHFWMKGAGSLPSSAQSPLLKSEHWHRIRPQGG